MRNFDEEFALDKRKGVEFVLGGHTFQTRSVIPPAALLSQETGLVAAVNLLKLFLVPDDKEVFEKMVEDPDVLIAAEQIDEIAGWLIGELSGRPTVRQGSSGNGRKKTSTGSRALSPVVDKTGNS